MGPLNWNEEGGVPLRRKSLLQAFRDTIAQHGVNAKHSQPKGVDRDAERLGQFLVMFDFGALLFFVIRDCQFTIFFRQAPHTLFQTGVAALLHLFLLVKYGSAVGFFVELNVGLRWVFSDVVQMKVFRGGFEVIFRVADVGIEQFSATPNHAVDDFIGHIFGVWPTLFSEISDQSGADFLIPLRNRFNVWI